MELVGEDRVEAHCDSYCCQAGLGNTFPVKKWLERVQSLFPLRIILYMRLVVGQKA